MGLQRDKWTDTGRTTPIRIIQVIIVLNNLLTRSQNKNALREFVSFFYCCWLCKVCIKQPAIRANHGFGHLLFETLRLAHFQKRKIFLNAITYKKRQRTHVTTYTVISLLYVPLPIYIETHFNPFDQLIY